MRRSRISPQSSFELFLDTVCNTFGGILLIALLVAVQIRQTEYTIESSEPSSSPETILELQQKLDQLTNDIKLANTLRQNTQQTQTTPQNDNEKYLAANYDQLINTKRDSTVKKAELTSLLHKQKEENLQWENQMKTIETNIKNTENETNTLTQQIQKQKSEIITKKQSYQNKQNEIDRLNQQITQKENKPQQSEVITRSETLYLPKLHSSKTNQSAYLILRFNRIYDASSRNDFDSPSEDQLGIPKLSHGISIDTSDKSKNEFQKLLQKYNSKKVYISIIVYGDSADQFYIVRDMLIAAGFEYDLKPSGDNSVWTFSGNSGSQDVQH